MVKLTQEFVDQPKDINGFSDLMVSLFGEKGKHASLGRWNVHVAVQHCSGRLK